MSPFRPIRLVACSVFCLSGVGVALFANATTYSLTGLGTLPDTNFSAAKRINNAGQVVGISFLIGSGTSHAVLWSGGSITSLDGLGPLNGAASINSSGQVVGDSSTPGAQKVNTAVLWSAGTLTPTDLGAVGILRDGRGSFAYDINDAGQVVGAGDGGAILWSGGSATPLGALVGTDGLARGINNIGQAVGYSRAADGLLHATLWSSGSIVDLGTPGEMSNANDINDMAQVVGYRYIPPISGDAVVVPVLWNAGIPTDLPVLGGTNSSAYAINTAGSVVGYSYIGGVQRAMIWENGLPTDLNTVVDGSGAGWTLNFAADINDVGQIVGYGTNSLGQTRGIVLTPIPEPGTYALMLVGLGLVGLALSRRKRAESNGITNMRQRTQRDYNQQWYWQPGELLPERGPDLGRAIGE
jgi:probable HAF family extracellular repeat protein